MRKLSDKQRKWLGRGLRVGVATAIVGLLAMLLGALYLERMTEWVIGRELKKMGLEHLAVGVRALGAHTMVLGPVELGEGDQRMGAAFVRVDFDPMAVKNRRIERVEVSGLVVNLHQKDGAWEVAGLAELMAIEPSEDPMLVATTVLHGGELVLHGEGQRVRRVPFEGTITGVKVNGVATYSVALTVRPNGDSLSVKGVHTLPAGPSQVELSSQLRMGAEVDWLGLVPGLPIPPPVMDGPVSLALDLGLKDGALTVTHWSLTSSKLRVLTALPEQPGLELDVTLTGLAVSGDLAMPLGAPAAGVATTEKVEAGRLNLTLDGMAVDVRQAETAERQAARYQAAMSGVTAKGRVDLMGQTVSGLQMSWYVEDGTGTDGTGSGHIKGWQGALNGSRPKKSGGAGATAESGTAGTEAMMPLGLAWHVETGLFVAGARYRDAKVESGGTIAVFGEPSQLTVRVTGLPLDWQDGAVRLSVSTGDTGVTLDPADPMGATGGVKVILESVTMMGATVGEGVIDLTLRDRVATVSTSALPVTWTAPGSTMLTTLPVAVPEGVAQADDELLDGVSAQVTLTQVTVPLEAPWTSEAELQVKLMAARYAGIDAGPATMVLRKSATGASLQSAPLPLRFGEHSAKVALSRADFTFDAEKLMADPLGLAPDVGMTVDLALSNIVAAGYHVDDLTVGLTERPGAMVYAVSPLAVWEFPGLAVQGLHGKVNALAPQTDFSVICTVHATPEQLTLPEPIKVEGEPFDLTVHVSALPVGDSVKAQTALRLKSERLVLRHGETDWVELGSRVDLRANFRDGAFQGKAEIDLERGAGSWAGMTLKDGVAHWGLDLKSVPLALLQAVLQGKAPTVALPEAYGVDASFTAGGTIGKAPHGSVQADVAFNVEAKGAGDKLSLATRGQVQAPLASWDDMKADNVKLRCILESGQLSVADVLSVLPEWKRMMVDSAWQGLPINGRVVFSTGEVRPMKDVKVTALNLDMPFNWTAAKGLSDRTLREEQTPRSPGLELAGGQWRGVHVEPFKWPIRLAGKHISIAGGLKVADTPIQLTLAAFADWQDGLKAHAEAEVPTFELGGLSQLYTALPDMSATLITGSARLNTMIDWTPAAKSGTARLRINNVNIENQPKGYRFTGLQTDLQLEDVFTVRTKPGQRLSFQSAIIGPIVFGDVNSALGISVGKGAASKSPAPMVPARSPGSPAMPKSAPGAPGNSRAPGMPDFSSLETAAPAKPAAPGSPAASASPTRNRTPGMPDFSSLETAAPAKPAAPGSPAASASPTRNRTPGMPDFSSLEAAAPTPPSAAPGSPGSPAASASPTRNRTPGMPDFSSLAPPPPGSSSAAPGSPSARDRTPGAPASGGGAEPSPSPVVDGPSGGVITYQIESTSSIFLEAFDLRFLGGNMQGHAVRFNPADRNLKITLFGDDIQLNELLKLIPDVEGETDAVLYGKLPITITGGYMSYDRGFLYIKPGQSGNLKLRKLGKLQDALDAAAKQNPNVGLATEALQNFNISVFRMDFNDDDAETQMKIRLVGESKTDRIQAPLDLTVNFNGDFKKALNLARQIQQR